MNFKHTNNDDHGMLVKLQVVNVNGLMGKSLNHTNGLSAHLKAASLILQACFGSEMDSVIQTAVVLLAGICFKSFV